jgi:hypothetical protein
LQPNTVNPELTFNTPIFSSSNFAVSNRKAPCLVSQDPVAEADQPVQRLPPQDLRLNKPVLPPQQHTLPRGLTKPLLLLLLLLRNSNKVLLVQAFSVKWPAQLRKSLLPYLHPKSGSETGTNEWNIEVLR